MNLALALTQNQLRGVRVAAGFEGQPDMIARRLLLEDAGNQTREALDRAASEGKSSEVMAALVIGSPDFQKR
jgi:hypothetical protein